jgi:hypothetical protein
MDFQKILKETKQRANGKGTKSKEPNVRIQLLGLAPDCI